VRDVALFQVREDGVSAYIVLLALFIRRECYVVLALLFCFIEDSLEHVIQAAGLGDDGAADLRGSSRFFPGWIRKLCIESSSIVPPGRPHLTAVISSERRNICSCGS